MHDARDTSLGARLFARLLPAWFRERYGEELLALHAARMGRRSGFRFWSAVLLDAAITSAQLRRDAARERAHERAHAGAREAAATRATYTMRNGVVMASRALRQTPGFAIAVISLLGVGIGANVAMFTVLDRVLLSAPPHITAPDEVRRVFVHGATLFSPTPRYSAALTYPDYRALQTVGGFTSVAAYSATTLTLGRGEESERVSVEMATASYFPLLGVTPAAGRFFGDTDDEIGAAIPVAVLGHGFWQRRFGGDRSVIGETIELGLGRYTIVGIAPRAFTGVDIAPIDIWVPLHAAGAIQSGREWVDARGWYWMTAIARVDDTRLLSRVEAEATGAYRTVRAPTSNAAPTAGTPSRVVLAPVIAALGPNPASDTSVAKLLGGVAVVVLLITCANVANLLLARGVRRRKQYAVQRALGVSRGGLIAQVLAESAVLSVFAGVVAFVAATAVAPALFRLLVPGGDVPNAGNLRVVLATLGLSFATCVIAGAGAAMRASNVSVADVLRAGRAAGRSSWTRLTLLGAQSALSVMLLIGAGLFIHSLREAQQRDLGLDLNVATIGFEMQQDRAENRTSAEVVYAALEHIERHPLVESAAVTNLAPFNGFLGLQIDAPRPDSVPQNAGATMFVAASPRYFRTMGLSLVSGRDFTAADDRRDAPPAAIVNRAMAELVWPGRDAVGQCLLIGGARTSPSCTTVIGVVSDIRYNVTANAPQATYYLPPHHPANAAVAARVIVARMKDHSAGALASLQTAARAVTPDIRRVAVGRVGDPLASQTRSWRLGATLLTAFGALALLVAAGGLYSVLAFDVAQRTLELGIRAALGAHASALVRAAFVRTLTVAGAGVVVGAGVAAIAAQRTAALLFETSPTNGAVYLAAAGAMLAVAVAAALGPALRATRVDPGIAMRGE